MTKKEIKEIFIQKTIVPFVYIIICGIIFMPLAKTGGRIDLGILFVCTSYVFGVVAVRKKLKIDKSMPIKTRIISIPIELIGGFIIGIAAYIYAIAVALYYIPVTILNLTTENDVISKINYHKPLDEVEVEGNTPVLFDFTNHLSDENQLQIMKEMQKAREYNIKSNK